MTLAACCLHALPAVLCCADPPLLPWVLSVPPQTGGHPSIAPQGHKFVGIRNGIDPELWSPEDNMWLTRTYDAETAVEGKAAARKVRLGFRFRVCMFFCVPAQAVIITACLPRMKPYMRASAAPCAPA